MVTHDKLYIYKNWSDLSLFPWKQDDFNWKKRVIYGKQKYIDTIRKAALGHDAIIVATDYNPTGEGAVLAYEILEKIGWQKKIYRIHFADETPRGMVTGWLSVQSIDNYKYVGFKAIFEK